MDALTFFFVDPSDLFADVGEEHRQEIGAEDLKPQLKVVQVS